MLKEILSLDGVQKLSKPQQQSLIGGSGCVRYVYCIGEDAAQDGHGNCCY